MARIYTKSGDDGTTGLVSGQRVSKSSIRIDSIGSLDELNSFIGLSLTEEVPKIVRDVLHVIQHNLFDIGGEIATPGSNSTEETKVKYLEKIIDDLTSRLDILREFILPGGCKAAAQIHVARAMCRKAERSCIALGNVNPITLRYLNRLSDLLFTIARYLNAAAGIDHVYWKKDVT
jgi:cob(I)alamin adenosyltransferase